MFCLNGHNLLKVLCEEKVGSWGETGVIGVNKRFEGLEEKWVSGETRG